MDSINLGDRVIDAVTSYEGTVTAICHELDGSSQARVESLNRDTGAIQYQWIDLGRLSRP